jgi:hypothetical protein
MDFEPVNTNEGTDHKEGMVLRYEGDERPCGPSQEKQEGE